MRTKRDQLRQLRCMILVMLTALCLSRHADSEDAQAQEFLPHFKEVACKVENTNPSKGFGLGLRYYPQGADFIKKVVARGKAYTFESLGIGLSPEQSGIYYYWRPAQPSLFMFGYSNECVIFEGKINSIVTATGTATVTGTPAPFSAGAGASPVVYKEKGRGCCMVYFRYMHKVTATPTTASVGDFSDDLRNIGHVYGWHGEKDCSKTVARAPDYHQSIMAKPFNYAATVTPGGEAVAWYIPLGLTQKNLLRMSDTHGGSLAAECKALPHTFSKRPPPKPFPDVDDLPPFPKGNSFAPYVEKKDFVWVEPQKREGPGVP